MAQEPSEAIKQAATALTLGAAVGAVTKHAITPKPGVRTPLAVQVGSAMGAAAVSGAGVSGSLIAGGTVITAKVAAVAALGVAAAPVVLVAGAAAGLGYGVWKFFKK